MMKKSILLTTILFLLSGFSFLSMAQTTIYVDADATTGANNGSSWSDAYTSLQDAIAAAVSGDDIWVAAGTYKPSAYPAGCSNCSTNKDFTFLLKNGVELYGGFSGSESPGSFNLDDRDFDNNETILSGDFNGDDTFTGSGSTLSISNNLENAHHVVLALFSGNTATTRLDGFTIKGGNSNSSPFLTINGLTMALNGGGGIYLEGGANVIANNVVTNNSTNSLGGGIRSYLGNNSILNNTITNNKATNNGGGLEITEGTHTIINNTITGNLSGSRGGGIHTSFSVNNTFKNNTIRNNNGGRGGGVDIDNSTNTFINNIISENISDNIGGGMYISESQTNLTNNTFWGNSAQTTSGGVEVTNSSTVTVVNSIFWNNERNGSSTGGASDIRKSSTSTLTIQYSITQDGSNFSSGTGIIDNQDPLFTDPANGDYSISNKSPALNSGNNQAYTNAGGDLVNDTDVAGNPRLFAGTPDPDVIDMGAYEFQDESFSVGPDGNNIFYVDINVPGGDGSGNSWTNAIPELRDALDWAANTWDGSNPPLQIWVAEGVYKPVLPADLNNVTTAERGATFTLLDNVELYGGFDPANGVDLFGERDWDANPTTLSGDIDDNDTTTNGVVTDAGNITGSNSYRIISSSGNPNTTILDGFTITGGLANGGNLETNRGGGMAISSGGSPVLENLLFTGNRADVGGGGIYNLGSSPSLTNISFRNNYAGAPTLVPNGAGMWNRNGGNAILKNVIFEGNNSEDDGGGMGNDNSNPELTDVIFINNIANTGAGMANYDSSNPILRNVIFSGNTSGGWGGGILNDNSSPTLINVVLSNNTSNRGDITGGGAIHNRSSSSPVLTNVVIWNNQAFAPSTESIYNADVGSVPVISNSLIDNSGGSSSWDTAYGTDSGNNLDTNPLFADSADPDGADNEFFTGDDGLALQIGSPAINSGTNAPFNVGGSADGVTTDLAGSARIFDNATVDMGPYEFQGNGVISGSPSVTIASDENAGWRMMSVPVTGITVADLVGINLVQGIPGLAYDTFDPNIYIWNSSASTPDFGYSAGAYEAPSAGTTELNPGTGFIWYMYGPEANPDIPESKTFPLTIQLTGDETPGDVSLGTLAADWHLIGNPFIDDINFNEITDGTGSLLGVAGQVWDPNSGAEGSYVLTTSGALGNTLSAWQGAFINLTSSTEVIIPQSAKTTGGTFLKGQEQPLAGQVEFLLEGDANGERMVDMAAILHFSEEASDEWDGYDVPKLTPFSQNWATVNLVGDRDGEQVYKSQHSLPYDFTGTQEIPIDIQVQNIAGDFTLSWPVVSNLPQVELWLVDRQTGTRYDLTQPGSVDFILDATTKQAAATAETSVLKLPSPEPLRFKQSSESRFVIQVNPESVREELPEAFTLNQNYPNPFNPTTIISYELPQAADVRLEVFDMAGRQVATLVNEQVSAGRHTVNFDASNLSSGVYMYRLQTQSGIFTRKLTLIK